MALTADVRKGRLAGLKALRDELAEAAQRQVCCECDKPLPSQLAPLARQLQDVLRQIEELEKAAPKGSRVDELAKRRTVRRADASDSVPADGSGVERGKRGGRAR